MKITHIGVYVKDLEKSKHFYTNYFKGVSNEKYSNTDGFSSYFLTFEDGASLEIMHHTNLEILPVIDKSTGWSHLAFSVESRENVVALTARIVADGYILYSPLRETGDGYFESCVSDPDGNRIEITI